MQYFISIVKNHSFTKAGKYFYTHSQDVLDTVDQLIDNTVKIVKDEQIELKVGYLRNFGTTEFLKTVSQFSKSFPQVKINITSGNHEQLFELLKNGQIDMNFSDQRRALSNEYVNEYLTDSKFMLAVSRSAFADENTQMYIAKLADIPCVLIADNDQREADESYYREILGVKSDFVLAQNYDEAQILVASNQGYLIVNDRTQKQLNSEIVKTFDMINGKQQMIQKYYAYWKADNSGYYIESFAELLKKSFA